jgi:aspartate carbamoyltransferase catalytic subunit
VILTQVENGISVRMAVLESVLGGKTNAGTAH